VALSVMLIPCDPSYARRGKGGLKAPSGLGRRGRLVMQRATSCRTRLIKGNEMAANSAQDEPVMQDMNAHRRDYAGFTKLFTYGAIASFAIGIIVLFIIA
jgi:hypothetical protein